MNLNFKKISAIGTSILMAGMSVGFATAANYPAPFVSGAAADVAIVYGTGSGVSTLDSIQAGNIQTDLQRYLSGGTGGTGTTTSGEIVALDTNQDRVWLNTSLNSVKTTLTSSDLPTVLADHTFSGNVEAKMTSTIKMLGGAAAGGEGSNKVIFARQPKTSNDPVLGISLGGSSQPFYNATATFPAINFSHADSEGESVNLFGQSFTISSATDADTLVLLKESTTVSLSSDNPSATVEIGGETYILELISASDTAATVQVTNSAGTSDSDEVSESGSKKINGLEIGVKNADETNLKLSATIIAGAKKLTFENGQTVTEGSSADPVDGTKVFLVGGVGALTEFTVQVYRPDTSEDAILEGTTFLDPVFGSFKVNFAGVSSPLNSDSRDMISVGVVGDDTISLTMTDDAGNAKTFDFAHNASNQVFLGDDSNNTIKVMEGANLTENDFVVIGNENYGHLLEVIQIYNNTGSSYSDDKVKLQDVISGTTYDTTFSSEGTGTVYVEGKGYTVTFQGSGDEGWFYMKYPTSDAAATEFIVYPTIKTNGGALVALYEPLSITLNSVGATGVGATKLWFPDGDGYTGITLANPTGAGNWSVVGGGVTLEYLNTTGVSTSDQVDFTIGGLVYNLTYTSGDAANVTKLYVTDPEGTANIARPGLVIFEGKDDKSEYHAMVVDLEANPAGTSTAGFGVNDVLFSSDYGHYSATLQSDSDITHDIDWWGTLVVTDASDSDQKVVNIKYPSSQIYAQLYVGEDTSAVTPGSTGSGGSSTPLGEVVVMDTEISSVSSKNLIVVGGSCINSAAATLVGGAYCGDAWMEATGVGAGQFMLKGYASNTLTSKLALLVAGYNAADTVNAAKYLRTQTVDTGMHYKGTSSTVAELVTATA